MMKASLALMLLSAALCVAPTTSFAQLRQGQPTTLPRPQPRADPALVTLGSFKAAYSKAGAPRMVILWNRSFSDEVATEYEQVSTRDIVTSNKEIETTEETAGVAGNIAKRELNTLGRETGEERSGTKRVKNERAQLLPEVVQWDMERNFQQTLAAGGARLVDRTTIMRVTGGSSGISEQPNLQALEMQAMAGHADWVVEVLLTVNKNAPDGISFSLSVRDLRSARLLANIVTAGRPPEVRQPLIAAGSGGFVRATAPPPTPAEIASQLAIDLMNSLAASIG